MSFYSDRFINIAFGKHPFANVLSGLKAGETLPASVLLTLLDGESEEIFREAFDHLDDMGVSLDISDLPKAPGTGEAALRLRQEEQLAASGDLLAGLEETDPLRLYLEDLAGTPVCGDAQLLAEQAAGGDESARNMLVNLSLGPVVAIAEELTGNGVLLLDLIQEGSLGLWESILSYTGGNFEAHRDWHIRQSMAQVITLQARAGGVGQKMRQALEDYRAVDEQLLTQLGRNPSLEEIAEAMHMSVEEVASVKETLDSARMMHQAKEEAEPAEADPEEDQAVEDTAYFQMRQRIEDLLSGLQEADAKLLTLRFGLEGGKPLTPEETGRRLGLTPEEVVAREAAALLKLRNT